MREEYSSSIFLFLSKMFQETAGVQVYENPASCNSFYKCENGTATAEVFALRAARL